MRLVMKQLFAVFVVAVPLTIGGGLAARGQAPVRLPYTAVHDPAFISASEATFMNDDDRVIGVIVGTTAKAFPAGILSQHGLVEDQSPKGPIAITW
jgi:hypothetical protein